MGITQVTWSLGKLFVVAMRIIDDSESGKSSLGLFRMFNRNHGIIFTEVRRNAKRFPSLELLPAISLADLERIAWFMSPMPISPIGEGLRKFEEDTRQMMDELGTTYTEIH